MLPAVRLLALCLVLVVVAPADAAPRRGKVVRVERARTGPRGVPRTCQVRVEDGNGHCWGRAPVKGETAVVVDPNGRHGTIQVREVTARDDGNCAIPSFWEFQFDLLEGDLKGTQPYQTWALIDVDVTPAVKMLEPSSMRSPSGNDGEQPFAVFDRDGNADPDFAVVAYACDADGKLVRNGQPGYCMDYWIQPRGSRWTLARRDIVPICNR